MPMTSPHSYFHLLVADSKHVPHFLDLRYKLQSKDWQQCQWVYALKLDYTILLFRSQIQESDSQIFYIYMLLSLLYTMIQSMGCYSTWFSQPSCSKSKLELTRQATLFLMPSSHKSFFSMCSKSFFCVA